MCWLFMWWLIVNCVSEYNRSTINLLHLLCYRENLSTSRSKLRSFIWSLMAKKNPSAPCSSMSTLSLQLLVHHSQRCQGFQVHCEIAPRHFTVYKVKRLLETKLLATNPFHKPYRKSGTTNCSTAERWWKLTHTSKSDQFDFSWLVKYN